MGGWQYSYDAENRLTGLDTTSPRARFVYDGLGRCVERTINGVTTVMTYDDWKPIMEWSSPTQLAAWNAYGPGADEILWRWQSGVGYLRYHSDRHGNVTALLDYWGGVVEKYSYDAFGRPTILSANNTPRSSSAVGNRFMFQGREYFPELGLYDFRHPFYDPYIGRFIQTDPTGFDAGDMNLFRYCGDDPVDRSDPMGLDWAAIDSETESWSLKASEQNLAARQKEGWSLRRVFINMTDHSEFSTTVYRGNGKVGMSQPYTDGNRWTVMGRDYAGNTSLVYTHTHNHNKNSTVTKSHLSVPDVRTANNKGIAVQVTTPSGEVDRARPSTASTRDGRWNEGATIERLNSEKRRFEPLKGANANVPRYGAVDEGMAGQDQSAPSAKDVGAANRATGVPSLGAEAVNFVRASRL